MSKKLIGVGLLLLAAPGFAADFSYNYVEAGYYTVEIDDVLPGLNVDGDGLALRASIEVNDDWYVVAGYNKADYDFGVDADTIELGAGYHVELSGSTDFFTTLSYVRAEASAAGFGSADEDGLAIDVGARVMVSDRFEIEGALGYVDMGDGADGTVFSAVALYEMAEAFALGATLELDEESTAVGVGVRLYFGH